jgi:hypothetical protein
LHDVANSDTQMVARTTEKLFMKFGFLLMANT